MHEVYAFPRLGVETRRKIFFEFTLTLVEYLRHARGIKSAPTDNRASVGALCDVQGCTNAAITGSKRAAKARSLLGNTSAEI